MKIQKKLYTKMGLFMKALLYMINLMVEVTSNMQTEMNMRACSKKDLLKARVYTNMIMAVIMKEFLQMIKKMDLVEKSIKMEKFLRVLLTETKSIEEIINFPMEVYLMD